MLFFKEINNKYDTNSIFAKCNLWYARFRGAENIPTFDTEIWSSYFLWQFACEINSCECYYDEAKKACKNNTKGQILYNTNVFTPLTSTGKKSVHTGWSCPYKVNGTMCDIDLSVFYGTAKELKKYWSNVKISQE